MKSKVYKSSLAKRIVLALAVFVLSLSVVSQSQAKELGSIPGKPTIAVVSTGSHPGMNIDSGAERKGRVLYVIARNGRLNPKSPKVLSKGCGCAAVAPQEAAASGFWSCLKGCMSDAGVSYYSMAMCGASCAAAETGIGAIVCAICVGATVTIVEVCALGCAMNGGKGFGGLMDVRAIKHRPATSKSLQAKLRLQPAKSKI